MLYTVMYQTVHCTLLCIKLYCPAPNFSTLYSTLFFSPSLLYTLQYGVLLTLTPLYSSVFHSQPLSFSHPSPWPNTVLSTFWTPKTVQSKDYNVKCTMHSFECTLDSVPLPVYILQCIMHSAMYTVLHT